MRSKIFLLVALFCAHSMWAQNEGTTPKCTIGIGLGSSLTGIVIGKAKDVINTVDKTGQKIGVNISLKTTPVLNTNFEYRFKKKFGLGLAYSYQSFKLNYDRYLKNDSIIKGDFTDKATRRNFGLLANFHFIYHPHFDPYIGTRISYMKWDFTSDTHQNYTAEKIFKDGMRAQLYLGMNYFFTKNIGASIEFGLGPPYFAQLGVKVGF